MKERIYLMFMFLKLKIFVIAVLSFSFLNQHAFSSNWKRYDNIECSIKSNHPELLETKPSCTSWSSNYHHQELLYLKTKQLQFFAKLELAQPGYYWYDSGDIKKSLKQFNFIKDNVKFKKSILNPVLSSNFWSRKPDNFDVQLNNSKFNNMKCFGFWDGGADSSVEIGRRYNLYGMICNLEGKDINISKRKEFLNHIYINHKYVNVNPKPWTKTTVKNDKKEKSISNENKKTISNKTKHAKNECIKLGFNIGTEKFGDCVLKLMD